MSSDRQTHKRLAMRKKIRHTVLNLLTANGFDNVTVGQIADTADVSPMTFCRHSRTKEAIIVGVILTGSIRQTIHHEVALASVAGTPEKIVDTIDSTPDDSVD